MKAVYGAGKEWEVKFLDIHSAQLRKKIKSIGGILTHGKTKHVRMAYHLPKKNIRAFAQVTQKGKETTMSVKVYQNKFPDNYEITTSQSFEEGKAFLDSLGLVQKAYQESYITKWTVPKRKGIKEITINELPGLPPYMQMVCTSKTELNKAVNKLDMDKSKMRFGPFALTYIEYYGVTKKEIELKVPKLTFKNIQRNLGKYVRRHKELFKKIANKQKRM